METRQASDELKRSILRIEKILIAVLYLSGVMVAAATAFIPPMFTNWTSEYTIFTYATSQQYFLASLMAGGIFWLSRTLTSKRSRSYSKFWGVTALAFAFAAADELLTLHENIGTKLEHVIPGLKDAYSGHTSDLILLLYMVFGAFFAVLLARELFRVKSARPYLLLGAILALSAMSVDVLLKATIQLKLLVYGEELCEYFAGTSFAAAFAVFWFDRLEKKIGGVISNYTDSNP